MSKDEHDRDDKWSPVINDRNELSPEVYPEMVTISAAMMYRFLPVPKVTKPPECVYMPRNMHDGLAMSWNFTWEAGQLRNEVHQDLPVELAWLGEQQERNIYLIPRTASRLSEFSTLFHLLPVSTLTKFGLPALRRGVWPMSHPSRDSDLYLPRDFETRLSRAFAYHVWPYLDSGSRLHAYSPDEPIRVLAHNLDFWWPHAQRMVEQRMSSYERAKIENRNQARTLARVRKRVPPEILIERPRKGGHVWLGEEEAREATKDLIEFADRDGRLRGILDAVRSNRVQDDFSSHWSFAREDFERRMYKKRSKVKVTFVELTDTIPVLGPESEVIEKLMFEDFMALLNPKERRITVLMRSGVTALTKIAAEMGYANHSPVSKALARIRKKATLLLD